MCKPHAKLSSQVDDERYRRPLEALDHESHDVLTSYRVRVVSRSKASCFSDLKKILQNNCTAFQLFRKTIISYIDELVHHIVKKKSTEILYSFD